ncbi:PDGLE domain-containing protein [Candidatus Omnitrophota bacterium]
MIRYNGSDYISCGSFPVRLEKVAGDKGFLEKGEGEPVICSPVADYLWPGVKSEGMATSLAGIFGTLLVFGLGCGMAVFLRKRSR